MRVLVVLCMVLVVSLTASATIQLHWAGLGDYTMGGYYMDPPTNGVGYGLKDYHGNWACEIVFDSVSGIPGIADGSPLVTICMEWDEELIGENDFTATLNTAAINGGFGGGNPDPMSDQTAWIFTEYNNGNTFNITDVNRRAAVVQEAIWSIEEELDWAHDYTETDGLIALANAAVNGGWTNQDVRVLNIEWENGTDGQDVLVIIPEPMTIALLGIGGLLFATKRTVLTK